MIGGCPSSVKQSSILLFQPQLTLVWSNSTGRYLRRWLELVYERIAPSAGRKRRQTSATGSTWLIRIFWFWCKSLVTAGQAPIDCHPLPPPPPPSPPLSSRAKCLHYICAAASRLYKWVTAIYTYAIIIRISHDLVFSKLICFTRLQGFDHSDHNY